MSACSSVNLRIAFQQVVNVRAAVGAKRASAIVRWAHANVPRVVRVTADVVKIVVASNRTRMNSSVCSFVHFALKPFASFIQ